ncbi:DUF4844 domain-containing protein [Rhodocytophaga rosea]|uniref:DUF4844 domain-containing protein n=1 Tax=Rhodocytophaga rosea TaxID=2704465 RepID=A0A6C0GNC9_9BACT|nr:DUF4844 domain-containing protein [Rhodocytophaga rosea]QHT69130.1 DUF4844 domain-containing protein [Rhodocytophaga rosea]
MGHYHIRKNIAEQLYLFKTKDKFPIEDWNKRGLIPSSDDVRHKMNQEVNRFIDFVVSKLNEPAKSMTDEIQTYLDEWDKVEFDTEETYYITDILCEVMAIANVKVDDIEI